MFNKKQLDTGADPRFQVRGGALKQIAPSGGRRESFWGISCENKYFFQFFFGGGAGCAPPGSAPGIGHKFHNLETSSPIHTWINIKWTYIILYTYFILSEDKKPPPKKIPNTN